MEKQHVLDLKNRTNLSPATPVPASEVQLRKEKEKEGQRQIDQEVMHQNEEANRRALAKKMLCDAATNSPSFNVSCSNLLSNYQGKEFFFVFYSLKQYFYIFLIFSNRNSQQFEP